MSIKNFVSKLCLFSLIGINFVSCATIINGTTQKVPISSEPMGADIYVDGTPVGYTPATIELKRKNSHLITLSKHGYEQAAVRMEPVLSAAVAGNIVAGGFIGWGVDAVSGSQYRLIPETVHVQLRPYDACCYAPLKSPTTY